MTLLAEDLLLLLLDDESGALSASSQIQVALGGAVLADLALLEAVVVGEKSGWWHTAKVTASGPAPTDPVLAAAYAQVAEKERSAQDLVLRLGKGLKDRLMTGLVERGVVEQRKDRALGIFPRTRWPAVDSSHEETLRRDLANTLLHGLDPSPPTAALVALLAALDQAHKVLDHDGISDRDLKKRAKAVAEGQWAAKGVSDAIAAANAAVIAAIAASTTTATTAS